MSERAAIAFLTGCMFVVGLHLESAGRLLLEGWSGPYREARASTDERAPAPAKDIDPMAIAGRGDAEHDWTPGNAPGL